MGEKDMMQTMLNRARSIIENYNNFWMYGNKIPPEMKLVAYSTPIVMTVNGKRVELKQLTKKDDKFNMILRIQNILQKATVFKDTFVTLYIANNENATVDYKLCIQDRYLEDDIINIDAISRFHMKLESVKSDTFISSHPDSVEIIQYVLNALEFLNTHIFDRYMKRYNQSRFEDGIEFRLIKTIGLLIENTNKSIRDGECYLTKTNGSTFEFKSDYKKKETTCSMKTEFLDYLIKVDKSCVYLDIKYNDPVITGVVVDKPIMSGTILELYYHYNEAKYIVVVDNRKTFVNEIKKTASEFYDFLVDALNRHNHSGSSDNKTYANIEAPDFITIPLNELVYYIDKNKKNLGIEMKTYIDKNTNETIRVTICEVLESDKELHMVMGLEYKQFNSLLTITGEEILLSLNNSGESACRIINGKIRGETTLLDLEIVKDIIRLMTSLVKKELTIINH